MILGNIKIRIKIGSNEIEIESPLELMDNVIELIPKVTEKFEKNINSMPSITIDKNDSLSDIILKIFKDNSATGRRLSDVKSVLESYGLSYPKQSIAVALMRLVKNGKLRRFKNESNEYVYTANIQLRAGERYG